MSDNDYLLVENTNLLTIGTTFPYSILKIENVKGELLFDIRQNEDGTVKSDLYSLDKAATMFFDEVIKRSQEYALSCIKDNLSKLKTEQQIKDKIEELRNQYISTWPTQTEKDVAGGGIHYLTELLEELGE